MIAFGLCGVLGAAGAWWWAGTLLGGLLWAVVLVAACAGYGGAFAHLVGRRLTRALSAVVGMGVLLAASTALARAGMLRGPVQLGLVAFGLAACFATRPEVVSRAVPLGVTAFVLLAGALVIGAALVGGARLVGDGTNHVLAVKRLWDTGTIAIYHQAGAQLVGESLGALASGAQSVAMFDEGLCVALLVWLLASELGGRGDELGVVLFVVLAIPVVLHPAPERDELGTWAAVVLELGAFTALDAAIAERRSGWLAVPPALALACLHHELALIATPCLAAAFVLPHPARGTRRTAVALAAAWTIGLGAMELAFHLSLFAALWRLGAIWLAVPLARAAASLLGVPARSAYGALAFALVAFTLAVGLGAISPSFVGDTSLAAVSVGAAIWLAIRIDGGAPSAMRTATAALVVMVLISSTILDTNLDDGARARTIARFAAPAAALRSIEALGLPTDADDRAAALQRLVPVGKSINFWGQSAARLDFARNRIVDLSWAPGEWRTLYFLSPIAPRLLHRGDYLIVENMRGHPDTDSWGTFRASPTELVANRLESLAIDGQVRLYRVR